MNDKILPKEIKKTDFKKSLRGYETTEVDTFLETVSLRYERLYEENILLIEQIKNLTSDLQIYKENESTLQKAIVKSQDLTEEIIQTAKKKSENIIKEAELESQKILQDSEKEIFTKKQELDEIKSRNDKLVEDVKHFFLEKLNEMDEFVKSRNKYKMELTKHEHSENEDEELPKEEMPGIIKKISINTANSDFSE